MLKEKKFNLLGKILMILTTVAWGSSFIVLKTTLSDFGGGRFTFFILAARFLLAALCIFLFIIPKLKTLKLKTVVNGCVLGLILFGAYAVQTLGLKYTTPSKNAFLTVSYCIFVPFLSWLILRKKPTVSNFAAAALCLTGVAFVALIGKTDGDVSQLLGDALSVGCGVFYALQIIYLAKYGEDGECLTLLFFELLVVGVLCACVSLACEIPFYSEYINIDFDFIWKICYLALVCTCFAQFSQTFAQKYVSPMATSLILSFECVFGAIFEMIFGVTELTPFIVIGFILIFSSQIVGEIKFGENKKKLHKIKNNS